MTPTDLLCSPQPAAAKDPCSKVNGPTVQAVTSFMIDDILNPSRSSRTISSSSGATEDTYCSEEAARRSDSPVSMFSEEADTRDGSPEGSDSDNERCSSQGIIIFMH